MQTMNDCVTANTESASNALNLVRICLVYRIGILLSVEIKRKTYLLPIIVFLLE